MDRRAFLAVAGASAFAGCNTARSTIRTGPPYYEEVAIDGPEEVEVGEEFFLEVSAKNTGGRTGTFSSTVSVGQGVLSVDRTAEIEDIPITETKTAEVGPIRYDRTTSVTGSINDYGASHTVSVAPAKLEWGQSPTIAGFETSIDDIEFMPSFAFTDDSDTQGVYAAFQGETLALVSLTVSASDGTDRRYPSADSFSLRAGSETFERANADLDYQEGPYVPSTMELYEGGGESSSGGSYSGVLVFEVPTDITDMEFTRSTGGTDEADLVWEFTEEIKERLSTVPSFEVVSTDIPDEVEVFSPTEASVTVQNVGKRQGTFNGVVEQQYVADDEWQRLSTPSREIPAGDTATITFEVWENALGQSDFVVFPVTDEIGVDFKERTEKFGDTIESFGIEHTAGDINFDGEYEWGTTISSWTETADTGMIFMFVYVSGENVSDEERTDYNRDLFTMMVDGDEYSHYKPDFRDNISNPVDGDYYSGKTLNPGESHGGWLAFQVPQNRNSTALRATISNNGPDSIIQWEM